MSASPARIWVRADESACMEEEHCFWTVYAGTSTGIPIDRAAVRAVFASSLRWMQSPAITSSTDPFSTPARASAASMTVPASWNARRSFSPPPNFPIGSTDRADDDDVPVVPAHPGLLPSP